MFSARNHFLGFGTVEVAHCCKHLICKSKEFPPSSAVNNSLSVYQEHNYSRYIEVKEELIKTEDLDAGNDLSVQCNGKISEDSKNGVELKDAIENIHRIRDFGKPQEGVEKMQLYQEEKFTKCLQEVDRPNFLSRIFHLDLSNTHLNKTDQAHLSDEQLGQKLEDNLVEDAPGSVHPTQNVFNMKRVEEEKTTYIGLRIRKDLQDVNRPNLLSKIFQSETSNVQLDRVENNRLDPINLMCNVPATTKSQLLDSRRQHPSQKVFACEKCAYRTFYESALHEHYKTHGMVPLKCAGCDYMTFLHHHIVGHLESHQTCMDTRSYGNQIRESLLYPNSSFNNADSNKYEGSCSGQFGSCI